MTCVDYSFSKAHAVTEPSDDEGHEGRVGWQRGVMAGKEGGPWGWRRSPAGAACCIMAAGGREVIDRPSRRSMAGPVCAGTGAGAGAPNNVLVAPEGEGEVCRPANKSIAGC